ncbi:2073_t:CDS:2, partial [Racocetra persica]
EISDELERLNELTEKFIEILTAYEYWIYDKAPAETFACYNLSNQKRYLHEGSCWKKESNPDVYYIYEEKEYVRIKEK